MWNTIPLFGPGRLFQAAAKKKRFRSVGLEGKTGGAEHTGGAPKIFTAKGRKKKEGGVHVSSRACSIFQRRIQTSKKEMGDDEMLTIFRKEIGIDQFSSKGKNRLKRGKDTIGEEEAQKTNPPILGINKAPHLCALKARFIDRIP